MEDIDKLKRAYQQISANRKKKIGFKLPKLLHLSMEDAVLAGLEDSLSGYYIELVGFRFYCLYKTYFDEVLAGQKPQKGSLTFDVLPKSALSEHDLQRVLAYKYHKVQVNMRSCPAILVDVCNYLQIGLNSKEPRNLFFRRLTMPLAIHALQERIEQKMIELDQEEEDAAKNPAKGFSQQLSLMKWWK